MIFNYDKETGSLNNGENLSNLKQEIVDFFTKKQDIVKPYSLTKGDNDFFAAYKTKITPDEINSNSENAIDLTKKLANQYSDCAGAIEKIIEEEGLLGVTESNLAKAQSTTIQGVTKFRAALTSVGSVIKSVGASMLNMGIAMVASWAVGKIIEGLIDLAHYDENIIKAGQEAKESIDNTFNSFKEGQQKVTDLATKFADSTDQIKTTGDAIDQVAEKYTELHKGVVGSTNENRSLSSEDYQSYLDICNQLAAQFPQLVSGYDAQGNALLNLGSNADSAADSIRNLYNAQMLSANVEIGENLQNTYKGTITQVEQYNGQISDLKEENEKLQAEMDEYTGTNNGKSIFTFGSKKLNVDNRKLTGEQIKAINNALHEFAGNEYSMQGLSDGTTVVDGLEDLSKEKIQQLNNAFLEAMNVSYDTEIKGLQAQINANKSKSSSIDLLIKDQWNSMANSLSNYLQTSEAFSGLDSSLQNAFLGHLTDIDLTSLSEDYDGLVLPFLYGEFIEPMNSLEPDAQESLSKLLTLDTSKLKQKEYYDQVHSVIEGLFPDDKDTQNQWLKALGLSDVITTASTEMGKIKTAFKGKVFENWIDNLSIDDISIGAQLLTDGFEVESGLTGWNKFLDAIANYKEQAVDLGDSPTLASVLADEDNEVSSSIDSLQSDLSSLSDTLSKLKTGEFTDTDLTDLIQQFPQLADQTDNLQESIVSLQADKLKSTIKKIDEAMSGASADEKTKAKTLKESLIKSADLSGITSKEINDLFREVYNIGGEGVSDMASREGAIAAGKFKESFASVMLTKDGREALYKALLDPEVAKSGFDGIMEAVQSNLSDIFNRRIDASNDLLSEISSVQSALSSQSIGTSISYDTFSSEDLKDYRSALEYVNGSMQINTQKVKELTQEKVKEQVATNNSAKAQKQQQYLQNAKQIEELRQKLIDNTNATGLSVDGIQQQINSLLSSNDAIVEQCSQLDLLNSSLMESIGIYQQWKDAQNASESGDMFDDAITASKQIDDTLNNTDSDIYGRVGRKDYQASLDFLIPDTVDSTDENAINSYLSSIDNLFTHNEDGERAGLNIEEFCKNAMDKGLMVLDEAGENYQVAGGKTMEDFAEGMNLSMPMVQAMFGEMQEFGANFDWSDEGIQTMGDIAVAATEASEALRSVTGNEDLKINLDVSDLETTEEKCSALDDTISEMNSVKAKVGVDLSEVDQANTIIQYCVAQKQQLEAPAVMNVDVSQVSGKIGEAVGLLQEFQTAQNTLQMQETLGMDTSEAQANVEAVADKIKGLDTNVKATLSIDDSSIDTIQDSISNKLTNEVMVKAGIDDSAIIGFQETKHDAKGEVDWDNDTTKVDAYAAAQKKSDGTVLWSNDISQVKTQFQAVGHINWGNTSAPTNGANSVNGTAHVSGTAKVTGDWGNKRPGTTLVGELGREMCVNPHTGRWYTVGDNGAEFVNIPQGAIVFNHVQTEELLSNGFTASRAVALASGTSPDISGTAFVSGNAMVTGGISVKQAQKSVVSGGNTAKATSATNADTKATKSHTKATEESTEATKKSMKTFDWVATRLETWEKKVKKISDQITDYITSTLKTSLLKKQMKTMNYEMKANTKGELAYMKKANSVAEKYTYYNSDGGEINVPIPKKYQKLVQSGAYRIEDMDTSTDEGKALAEAISEYQSWYDKAQDCKQAVIDLRNEQQKLFEQWANMPTEKAEKKIDRLTTGYNGINAISSRLTAATKGGSTQAVLAQTMKEDLAEVQEQKKSDNKALKSAKTANKKASTAKKKANNKVKSTAKSLLKTNLTDEQKKQVQAGKKIDSTGMSGSQKKKADAYNKAVTNKTKANKKATSAKSKLSTAKSNYNSSNSTYKSMKSNVNTALNAYDSGDSLSYMNSLVDQQVSGKKLEQDARKTAVEQANANLTTTKKQKTTSDKKLAKLQKKYKNSKNLTAAQKKKIAAGKEIDTTGITDAKQLKILTTYNNALADSKKKKENVTIATNALTEANENLMTAEVESAQATVEAVSTKFDNAKTYYEALLSYQEQLSKYQEKNIDLAKAHGDYEKSSDYDVKISNTQAERAIKQNELDELTKQLNDGVEAGTIVENSQEWLDMQTKIKEAQNAVADYDTQIEELKQSQIGVYYEEQFERAAEKVDRFRDKLDGLKSLISDDMKIDKNTGLLTESGALSITLDVDDINASTENLKTYIKERQQIINDYNAGKFGEDEYNQKLKDVDANIKSTTANIYSSRNSILELVKSQSQAEFDVLNKVIDKRKEALSAKKNYYDYDKTLKNKTKDIEVLERQIAALEGSTSAEDKARKAKLQEQLQSAKDDLNDTIVDHAYSMQTDSLDKLSTDLSEDLDTWINKISSNMEDMTNAINGAISNAGLSTASTINAISSILRHYGLSDSEISQSGLTNITGYASGTDYVNKSGIYRVNEKGMESVFSKQYGTLTFLNQGDKVFDANFTKSLLDNATIATQKNMPDYAGMAKAIEKNIQNIQNLSGNTYVNNFYIDGAQDTESILREIDKHLDKKIQAHDKKQVRDFKSLR
ncbi:MULTISPECIES: hypothetical protein [unclassified Ruminococcus]|uniref:hypothetical protein n=1 Tax=unclassified Ruminococcus TaxID=2608920 RepID=UPI00189EC80F|nr:MULTISPECIES: hypothetical protein [unclassified Ruminococcus]MDB8755720.1 hypothetical protein [Ruminococcus sp. 1001136sp1]MDB8759822.1 hypothetical protein [Ruminococcus sp. 1001136sp1]MDB8763878.1 hypothetical protein [Ruminococcus sp. 1001136sp1]MDB8767560.1 hypothetical protein [Ruminococcus sp. 1001136sp1]